MLKFGQNQIFMNILHKRLSDKNDTKMCEIDDKMGKLKKIYRF